MAKKLSEKQHAAIELLTEIGADSMEYQEIAERIGVSESTLRRWRTKDDTFIDEVIRQTKRKAVGDLPRVMRAVPDIIVDSENAAMLRTWLQSIGALTERVEVDNKTSSNDDVEDMKAKLERYRGGHSDEDKDGDKDE